MTPVAGLLAVTLLPAAQDVPFAKDIAAFVRQDLENPPAKGQVLFIGSSSFTMWSDMKERFPGVPVLNRGFGGSTLPDVIRNVDKIVVPYAPRKIIVYCGENDLAADPKLPAYMVAKRFRQLHTLIRQRLPEVPIVYVSMKPSPSRFWMRSRFIAGNRWIREFCESQKATEFLDVWPDMLGPNGWPKEEIFLKDQLHMNSKGYDIWTRLLAPYVK
jgi:lysophospholipase L1-like esterase